MFRDEQQTIGRIPRHDSQEIARVFDLIIGDGVTELRALDATVQGNGTWPKTYTGYFDDGTKLAGAVATINSAKGVYFVLNGVDPVLLARAENRIKQAGRGEATQDQHVPRRRWLPIDLDYQRPTGISTTDAEHDAAIDRAREIFTRLREDGWPDPIVADSGNGAHLLYRIDETTEDDGLVERCLDALAKRFNDGSVQVDTSVHNPSRIWKLYGTLACKGDSTEERPHRMARILSKPESLDVVTHERLEALAAEVTPPEPKISPRHNGITVGRTTNSVFDVAGFLARNGIHTDGPHPWRGKNEDGQRWILDTCPFNGDHDDRSAFAIQWDSGAIAAGCQHDSCSWKWDDLRRQYEPPQEPKNDGNSFPAPIESEHARNESSWVPIPATQLAAEAKPIEWIWGGYLALGFVTLLSALWKSGKTTLLARLMQAFERGEDMAGAIQPVRVLYVSEEPASIWARRVRELGLSDTFHFINLPFMTRPGRPEYEHFVSVVAGLVKEHTYGLVVIDTFGQVSPANDENAAAEMTAALMPLRQITEAGASLLLVHHSRKGDGKEFQASRGSGAIPGFADILIELRRYDPENDDSRRTLKAISRFEETPAEVVIELREDGYHAVGSKADVKQSDRLDVIQGILGDSGEPLVVKTVRQEWSDCEVIKPCERIVRSDLEHGYREGLWKRNGEGKRGSPYTYTVLDSFPASSPSTGAGNENGGAS